MYLQGTSDVEITDSILSCQRAPCVSAATVVFGSALFRNTTVYGPVVLTLANFMIIDSRFLRSTVASVPSLGGCLRLSESTGLLRRTLFSGCASTQEGGAVAATDNSTNIIIDDCVFQHCVSTRGGALQSGPDTQILNSRFSFSTASIGSAVYVACPTALISNNTFENNVGGAVYAAHNATIADCNFHNNSGVSAGALIVVSALELTHVTVSSCKFTENSGSIAGALYVENMASLSIDGSNFHNNTVRYESTQGIGGSAIAVGANAAGSTLQVRNSAFTKNIANSPSAPNAGTVAISVNSTLVVDNCTIAGNRANGPPLKSATGGIVVVGGSLTIRNNTVFSENVGVVDDVSVIATETVSATLELEIDTTFTGGPRFWMTFNGQAKPVSVQLIPTASAAEFAFNETVAIFGGDVRLNCSLIRCSFANPSTTWESLSIIFGPLGGLVTRANIDKRVAWLGLPSTANSTLIEVRGDLRLSPGAVVTVGPHCRVENYGKLTTGPSLLPSNSACVRLHFGHTGFLNLLAGHLRLCYSPHQLGNSAGRCKFLSRSFFPLTPYPRVNKERTSLASETSSLIPTKQSISLGPPSMHWAISSLGNRPIISSGRHSAFCNRALITRCRVCT